MLLNIVILVVGGMQLNVVILLDGGMQLNVVILVVGVGGMQLKKLGSASTTHW